MAAGSRKAAGSFWLPAGAVPPPAVMLVESAVDALSAAQIGLPLPPRTVILSAGAAAELPAWIAQWKPGRVICGYDADRAGDLGARRLERRHGPVERLRPEGRKDWNDILRDGRAQTPS